MKPGVYISGDRCPPQGEIVKVIRFPDAVDEGYFIFDDRRFAEAMIVDLQAIFTGKRPRDEFVFEHYSSGEIVGSAWLELKRGGYVLPENP